ncbi:MAG TPA: molecular chaperone DnaJ [Caulobacteraceae bacterium]|nr:molecular chaperone DnaJ [Caulobacteraceae bacterium]
MSAIDLTPDEARAILGLPRDAGPEAVMGAFRAAAKETHPDRPGGDAARFLEILSAYRLLQSLPLHRPSPVQAGERPSVAPVFTAFAEISPMTALMGGDAEAILADGRRASFKAPAGARHGEVLSVGGETVRLRIRAESAVQVRGSDLWVSAEIPARLLDEGGRAVVATPLGERALWINGKVAERRLVRLEGEGLPARAGHPQGSLYIRLVPDSGAPEGAARAQLKKFAAAWAA